MDVIIGANEGFNFYIKENLDYIEKETRSKIKFGKGKGFEKVWKIEGGEVGGWLRGEIRY